MKQTHNTINSYMFTLHHFSTKSITLNGNIMTDTCVMFNGRDKLISITLHNTKFDNTRHLLMMIPIERQLKLEGI